MTPAEITAEIRDIITAATARDDAVGFFGVTRFNRKERTRLRQLRSQQDQSMTTPTHSPLPHRVDPQFPWLLRDANGVLIADFLAVSGRIDRRECEGNARLAQTNSEIVSLLQECETRLDERVIDATLSGLPARIRAALAALDKGAKG